MSMKTILKYILHPDLATSIDTIGMPLGAKVLCTENQQEKLAIWVEVDTHETAIKPRNFLTIPTGVDFDIPDDAQYIGTILFHVGTFVLHLYEVT